MQFEDLYQELIDFWPEEILVSDAYNVSEERGTFPSLSAVNSEIEEKIDFQVEHWKSIGHWSLFQAFHRSAKHAYLAGEEKINTRKVPMKWIDENIQKNLEGEGWEEQRLSYIPLLTCHSAPMPKGVG